MAVTSAHHTASHAHGAQANDKRGTQNSAKAGGVASLFSEILAQNNALSRRGDKKDDTKTGNAALKKLTQSRKSKSDSKQSVKNGSDQTKANIGTKAKPDDASQAAKAVSTKKQPVADPDGRAAQMINGAGQADDTDGAKASTDTSNDKPDLKALLAELALKAKSGHDDAKTSGDADNADGSDKSGTDKKADKTKANANAAMIALALQIQAAQKMKAGDTTDGAKQPDVIGDKKDAGKGIDLAALRAAIEKAQGKAAAGDTNNDESKAKKTSDAVAADDTDKAADADKTTDTDTAETAPKSADDKKADNAKLAADTLAKLTANRGASKTDAQKPAQSQEQTQAQTKADAQAKAQAKAQSTDEAAAQAVARNAPQAQRVEAQTLTVQFGAAAAKATGQAGAGKDTGNPQDKADDQGKDAKRGDTAKAADAPSPDIKPQSNIASTAPSQSTQPAQPQQPQAPTVSTPTDNTAAIHVAAANANANMPATPATTASAATLQVGTQAQAASQTLPQPDLSALAINIAAKSSDGMKHFDIRMDPPELGRVDVRLSVDDAGKAQAHLTVDKPETLQMLQRDSRDLQRALKDAGLDMNNNGLNFSLKGQEKQDSGAQRFAGRSRSLSVRAIAAAETVSSNAIASAYASGNSRLDIRV